MFPIMQVETMKDSKMIDQCKNIKSYKRNNCVEFIPVDDGQFDSKRSTRNKTVSGNCVKSSLNSPRSKLNKTESLTGPKLGTNNGVGVRASRIANAEKLEGQLVKTRTNTTQSTEKASSTSTRRGGIRADVPWKISLTSIKEAQPYKSRPTGQVQVQKITTKIAGKPSASVQRTVQANNSWSKISSTTTKKSHLQKDSSLQTTVQANSLPKFSSTAPKKAHLQKYSSLQKTVQANFSSKLSATITKKAHLQKDSSSQKTLRQKIQKQPSEPSSSVQRRTALVNSSAKRSSMSSNRKTQVQKDSSIQKVSKEEIKKQTSISKPKRSRNEKPPKPVYHIRFNDFVSACESVTECCLICEKDLNPATNIKELVYYEDEYDDDYDLEPEILPSVSFFGCGHVFHSKCLDSFETEDPCDPLCFFCLSNLS